MEIIPKESPKTSKSLNVLLYFSLVFLFFSIASFFVLGHFYERHQKELIALEQVLAEPIPPEKLTLKEELSAYQKRIDDFSFLIDQQLESSKFFTAFEKIVHPQVWFSKISLNLEEKNVTLSGQARNFEVLWQQLYIIRNVDWIKNADLGTILMNRGGEIDFSLFLALNPKFWAEK